MIFYEGIKKVIMVILTIIITSFFYFPINFMHIPGPNTKTLMAAVGIVVVGWNMLKSKRLSFQSNLITVFIFSAIVSLAGVFSITYNNTHDDAYSNYITSMLVWLSAAYVVCCLMKAVHGSITVDLVSNYIIVVCVLQCISALLIDSNPVFGHWVDAHIQQGQVGLQAMGRLYGIGASLDVAGTRFAVAELMIVNILVKRKDSMPSYLQWAYLLAIAIIVVIGSMIARTTYVGVGMSAFYLLFQAFPISFSLKRETLALVGKVLVAIACAVALCVYEYNHSEKYYDLFRFAFESFFNFFEKGSFESASTNTLETMYVWPDNLKTWVIGDGYFSNPYWSDQYYTYSGQNLQGYYKGTDVGYCRFIFYFGIVGITSFAVFLIDACRVCAKELNEHKLLMVCVLLVGFVVWFKVATDLFLVFALFLCVSNMQDNQYS